MKTLFFLRSGPYEYITPGKDLYDSFNVVAKKLYDPHLTKDAKSYFDTNVKKKLANVQRAFSSADSRSQETARFIDKNSTVLSSLREIKYSMEDLLPKNEFYSNGSPDVNNARRIFVRKFIHNDLEPYEDVMSRIDSLLQFSIKRKENIMAFVSHGFYLKIIEAYIHNSDISTNSQKLLTYFDGNHETFKFYEGFMVQYKNGNFQFVKYMRNKENDI